MQEIIDYILEFLLRDKNLTSYVGYCSDANQWHKYKVVIVPSNFFQNNIYGTMTSLPSLPLKEIEGIPLLFGVPKIESSNGSIICHADIIASTYFLITRYEEFLFPETYRDIHGRFIGKESTPYKAKFINRPIVEEYGQLLRDLLVRQGITIPDTPQNINKIYLTHDVDTLTNYRRVRGFLGGIYRSILGKGDKLSTIFKTLNDIHNEPSYTFPWIYRQDNKIHKATPIYFIKAAKNIESFDYPGYNLTGKDFQSFIKETYADQPNTIIGLHASYNSGKHPDVIHDEKIRLQNALNGKEIICSRHHYLNALQPEDMEYLIKTQITDDFTMGYADIAGFRLGTCRAVRFINPRTKKLTNLTLHPLTMMDCTLSEEKYMNLNYEEALSYAINLIKVTKQYNGDLTLLWHNTTFAQRNYHKDLYCKLIDTLCI